MAVVSWPAQWSDGMGSNRTTTFVSSTQLTAAIPAVGHCGGRDGPGDGLQSFAGRRHFQCPDLYDQSINNPVPATTSLSPSSATAGGRVHADRQWQRFCGQFGCAMEWSESYDDVCFFDPVDSGDNGFGHCGGRDGPGDSLQSNAGWGHLQRSNLYDQSINNPVPTTTSLSPSFRQKREGRAFTLTVNGSGFVAAQLCAGMDRIVRRRMFLRPS